jgi:hypothetical protein
MAYTFVLTIDGVTTPVTDLVYTRTISRVRNLHNRLEPTTNILSFELARDATVRNRLMSAADKVTVTVTKDGSPYFTGYLTDDAKFDILASGVAPMKLQAEDPGIKLLKRKWASVNTVATRWSGLALCNPTTPAASLVHAVAGLAGVTVSPSIAAVATTVAEFVVVDADGKTYWDVLKSLLYCFGYTFGFDTSGRLEIYSFVVGSVSTTKKFSNTATAKNIGPVSISRNRDAYTKVIVAWKAWKTLTVASGIQIFSDTTGGDEAHKANITLQAGEYYPSGATAADNVYSEYRTADDNVIVLADQVTADIAKDAAISILATDNLFKRANLKLKNTDPVLPANIYQLDLKAQTVIIEDTKNKTTAGTDSDKVLDIDGEYVHDTAAADYLAKVVQWFYRYADYTYVLKSSADYQPGDVVQIEDTLASGISNVVMIVTREDSQAANMATYACVGVSAWNGGVTASTELVNNGGSVNNPLQRLENTKTTPIQVVDISEQVKANGSVPVSGSIAIDGYLKSVNYTPGAAGFAINDQGNAEFNDVTVRGEVHAALGEIGGFLISTLLQSAASGRRICLNPIMNRVEIWNNTGTTPVVAMGYLEGLSDPLDRQQQLGSDVRGFWSEEGFSIDINGAMQMAAGRFQITQDASMDVVDGEADKIMRIGNHLGNIGLHFFNSIAGSANNSLAASLIDNGDGRLRITTGLMAADQTKNNEYTGPLVAHNRALIRGTDSSNILTVEALSGSAGIKLAVNGVAKGYLWYNGVDQKLCLDTPDGVVYSNGNPIQTKKLTRQLAKLILSQAWAQTAMPSNSYWQSVCWSQELGLFCAVANSAAIAATSPDGTTWTQRTLPVSASWRAVCWAPSLGLFCAIADNSAIAATSPDGITWTQRALPSSQVWRSVCWSADLGLFCAVHGGGGAATSQDGITWTARTTPGNNWYSVCWSKEKSLFCAMGNNSTVAATSPDGITWTARTLPASVGWASVAWSPELGLFCAVALSSTVAATSPDGITWTQRTMPSASYWTQVIWCPDLEVFAALAGNNSSAISTSFDGITWTNRNTPIAAYWNSICWSNKNGIICAVADRNTAGNVSNICGISYN